MPSSILNLLQSQRIWLVFLLVVFSLATAQATHLKAGDITAKRDTTPNPNPLRFFFKMVIYTDRSSQAEDLRVNIDTGTGTTINMPRGQVMQVSPEVDMEIFTWEYTYPAPGTYTISWIGVNRHGRILNVAAPSDAHSFYLSTTISVNPFGGLNSLPVLRYPPIDLANVGRKFVHNPAAFDADGDSLSFKLITPRRQAANSTNIIPVPGYVLPSSLFNCTNATGTGASTFTLDPVTGQMVWDAPCMTGEFTVAFAVEEWRKTASGGVMKIGEVVRDMLITVRNSSNRPPVLTPKDTCIVAGTTLNGFIRATDPDNDLINLTAISGLIPHARFTPRASNSSTRGVAVGDFTWATTCADVRAQPYQVIFRAEDIRQSAGDRLVDLQIWNIRIVAPAPQNLSASREGSSTKLTWSNYDCQNASSIAIYRRDGIANGTTDECTPGLPASSGYVKIGEVTKGVNSFLDTNGGKGISPMRRNCYKVVAVFPSPSGGQSTASEEVCISPSRIDLDRGAVKDFVKIFPNPVKDRLNLNMLNNTVWRNLRIYSVTGQLLLEVEGNGQSNISVDLPRQAKGFHLLHIQTNNEVVIERVLLE